MKQLLFCLPILFVVFFAGCTKPDPNPHLADYIYQDIQRKLGEVEKAKATHLSNIDDLASKIKNENEQSIDRKILIRKQFIAKWEAEKAEQKINYYKMLLAEREKHVRESYLKSFSKGEKWDNSEEINKYKRSAKWEVDLIRAEKERSISADRKKDSKPASPPPSSHGGGEEGGGGGGGGHE